MVTGVIVWCLITIKTGILGVPEEYETSAKGLVTKINGNELSVDFSKYAREQKYIGNYYDIQINEDRCVQ